MPQVAGQESGTDSSNTMGKLLINLSSLFQTGSPMAQADLELTM